jgi:hypothetical protein
MAPPRPESKLVRQSLRCRLLSDLNRVIDFNAEVSDSAYDLRVSE